MRIGWFPLTFGLGQLASLAIGAVFTEGPIYLGWHGVGAVIFTATFLGRIHLPGLSDRRWHPEPSLVFVRTFR